MKRFFTFIFLLPIFAVAQAPQQVPQPAAQEHPQTFEHNIFAPIQDVSAKLYPDFWATYWYWILIVAIIACALLYLIFRPRKKIPPTPYESAKKRLSSAIEIYDTLGEKAYAQDLSQIVRDYIEQVHNIPAPERTTEEFLEIASESKIFDSLQRELLSKILKLADMAKFARHSFQSEEKNSILETSVKFIDYDNDKISMAIKSDGVPSDASMRQKESEKLSTLEESEEEKK